MTKKRFRPRAPRLAPVLRCLVAGPLWAQVPQDMTYTGRLVDEAGNPIAGPVDLELRIYSVLAGRTPLYSEQHLGVARHEGAFSVQLGLGTSPAGTFDAALFSGINRYLEVVAGAEVLVPRQVLAAVPWALADHQTGLQWEKKTGTLSGSIICEAVGCPDPHVVHNRYSWPSTGTDPDGGAFADFLARLNGESDPPAATGCFADHCDWWLPKISEFQTIKIGPESAPGQATTCSPLPCIDPGFAAIGGPTVSSSYWSATTDADTPTTARNAYFGNAPIFSAIKTGDVYVRAVRTGSGD